MVDNETNEVKVVLAECVLKMTGTTLILPTWKIFVLFGHSLEEY